MKGLIALLITGLFIATTASAQIVDSSPARQRAANRRALRDAAKYPAEYKDSHLAVDASSLKRGQTGRPIPADGRSAYRFDRTGIARISEPTTLSLRLNRRK